MEILSISPPVRASVTLPQPTGTVIGWSTEVTVRFNESVQCFRLYLARGKVGGILRL